MSIHPEYAELVKTALASDSYWPKSNLWILPTSDALIPVANFKSVKHRLNLMRDGKVANDVVSIVNSANTDGSIESIPYGAQLPTPNGRQVIKIVEDSRLVVSKLSPAYWLEKQLRAKSISNYRKYVDPDYNEPTFEEALAALYAADLTFESEAKAEVSYSLTKLAIVSRSVSYMRRDEESSLFLALPSRYADNVALESDDEPIESEITKPAPILDLIPSCKVGDTYNKLASEQARFLGKIVSAEIIEATSVKWKQIFRTSGSDNHKNEKHSVRPALNPAGWRLS